MSTTAETGGAAQATSATPPPAQTAPVVTPPVTAPPVVQPAATVPVVVTPPVVTPPPVADPAEVRLTSAQLKERLAEERAKGENHSLAATLKALGVEKLEDAKSRIDAALKLEDAQKSEIERAHAKVEKLSPRAARADELEKTLATYAAAELKTLTDEQQSIVISLAGDDPDKRLATIATLRPSWATPAPATTAAPVVTAPVVAAPPPVATTPAPLPPPATTAPASTAPPPAAGASTNHLATWETLKSQNPVRAAGYRAQFGPEIAAAEKARRG